MRTQKQFVISGMFKTLNILGICLILVALFAPTAHAETVFVNPGPVGGLANNFSFGNADPALFVDLVWSDNKTLEWEGGTHLFFLYGTSCAFYTGFLLDAAGNEIPDTEFAGRAICTAGSDLSAGVIDLPAATVFSGIRLISAAFSTSAGWQWNWRSDDRPVVGQTEASDNQPPVPDAGGPYEGVANEPVTFDASGSTDDGTITTYTWEFGDDTTLGGETITHTYASAGLYNVTLTVTDDMEASASTRTIADIGNLSLRPTADAGGPYTGETLVNVAFDGTGSTDDGTIEQYAWDFGDGSPVLSGLANPTHNYAAAATYYVVLTVTDNTGNIDRAVTTATIAAGNQAPVADAGPPAEGVVGTAVTFDGSNSSDAEGPIAQYAWDFGDGSPIDTVSGANPSHTYAVAGDYTVLLTVTDSDDVPDSASTAASIDDNPLSPRADAGPPAEGTTGVAVSFDGSGSDDADGDIVTYAWNFGDGSPIDTVSGANPRHTYAAEGSYTVTLTVTDNDGLTGTDTTQAAIDQANSPPTSDAGGPYSGAVDAPVLFDASASDDPDGNIVRYDWDFDDGGTGSGLFVTHTYTAPGAYTATLMVTDDDGDTDQSTATVNIGGGNQPPVPDAGGPYESVANEPVTFDASGSTDDGTITTYIWEFGDDTTLGGETITHTYASAGLYNVILTVTDNDGVSKSTSTIADIGNFSLRPTADAGGPYTGETLVNVAFDGTGSTDDGTIEQYAWDFGDGSPVLSGLANPTHNYAAASTYYVVLTVTDNTGNIDRAVTTATITNSQQAPVADAGPDQERFIGDFVVLDGSDSTPEGGVFAWEWVARPAGSAANLDGAATVNPDFTPDKPGTYTINLTYSVGTESSTDTVVVVADLPPPDINDPETIEFIENLCSRDPCAENPAAQDFCVAFMETCFAGSIADDDLKKCVAAGLLICSGPGAPAPEPPEPVTIGGSVSGLVGSGLVLQNNGGDDEAISQDGDFAFDTPLTPGSAYRVTVAAQPTDPEQLCTVAQGSGTVPDEGVDDVLVTCADVSPEPVTIGGSVSGLVGSGLVLQNNGGDDASISQDGDFAFDTPLTPGSAYRVTVAAQPTDPEQLCTVAQGSGTVPDEGVDDVLVTCGDVPEEPSPPEDLAFLPSVYLLLLLTEEPPGDDAITVFVTQPSYQGDLGGLAGADAICQQRAEAAELPGTDWSAWLSTSSDVDGTEGVNARDRIPEGRYFLVNGTLVANNKTDLTDGSLEAPINLNEYGQAQAGIVWTATNSDGTGTGNNCNNWTDASSQQGGCPDPGDPNCGSVGSTSAANAEWTELNAAPFQCSAQYNLYCFGGSE